MIILMGSPGSGKSTQAQMLIDHSHLKWLSISQLFREKGTQEHQTLMREGKLFKKGEVIKLLSQELSETGDRPEILLDGFPRDNSQARWLADQRRQGKLNVKAVLLLVVSKKDVLERMKKRGRIDDEASVIAKRFDIFEKHLMPILKIMKQSDITIIKIDASPAPEIIFKNILKSLQSVGVKV